MKLTSQTGSVQYLTPDMIAQLPNTKLANLYTVSLPETLMAIPEHGSMFTHVNQPVAVAVFLLTCASQSMDGSRA